MHTEGYGQFNVGGATGACDEQKIGIIFCFRKHLMHVGAQYLPSYNRQVNARKE